MVCLKNTLNAVQFRQWNLRLGKGWQTTNLGDMPMTYVLVADTTAKRLTGNPTLTRLDNKERCTFGSIRDSSPERLAEFGVYDVDTTPPEGQRWTGEFEVVDGLPIAVFKSIPPPSARDIDSERDSRIHEGFTFSGHKYQTRPVDLENIAGAATAALGAIVAGAQPEDYRWHGGDSDFVWISEDNELIAMDAQTMFTFAKAAMAHKQAHIFAARSLKDSDPIPEDYTDDSYWP